MKTNHSPLPWIKAEEFDGTIPIDSPVASNRGDESIEVCRVNDTDAMAKANSDLICRAVNSHYKLVEALEDMMNYFVVNNIPDATLPDDTVFCNLEKKAHAALELAKKGGGK